MMSDTESSVPDCPSSPSCSAHCLLSDDVLLQVLQWLPVPSAVHTGMTSKAFSRAALSSLRRAAWTTTRDDDDDDYCCRGSHTTNRSSTLEETASSEDGDGEEEASEDGEEQEQEALLSQGSGGRLLGTPCLDVRSAGDAVDCAALLGLLARGFKAAASTTTPAQVNQERQRLLLLSSSAGESLKPSVEGLSLDTSCPSIASSGGSKGEQESRPVLRGLAVRSSGIEDEVSAILRVTSTVVVIVVFT